MGANNSGTHLAPYVVITLLLTTFPVLYFTSPWLFCNYQLVLLNPFIFFTHPFSRPPMWQPSVCSLDPWVCFQTVMFCLVGILPWGITRSVVSANAFKSAPVTLHRWNILVWLQKSSYALAIESYISYPWLPMIRKQGMFCRLQRLNQCKATGIMGPW